MQHKSLGPLLTLLKADAKMAVAPYSLWLSKVLQQKYEFLATIYSLFAFLPGPVYCVVSVIRVYSARWPD